MQRNRLAMMILLVGATAQAHAQDFGKAVTNIALPSATFTLALNEAEKHVQMTERRLTLASPAKRDNFRDPNGELSNNSAPMLLMQVDNTKPFTFTSKVTPTLLETYDAGTLYLWVRDDLWLKMAMERDERGRTRLVTVRTNGTSDDNNHDVVTADSVYMKISSDATTIAFYYSLDNTAWQLIRLFRNDYPDTIWLGVSSQSPVGEGNSSTFEQIALTPTSVSDFRMGK